MLINKKRKLTITFISTILLLTASSCTSTKIKRFTKYEPAPILRTTFMPEPEALDSSNPKVVVLPFETGNSAISRQTNVNTTLMSSVEGILTKNVLADLVDRNTAEKLREEIALAEMSQTGSYEGPMIAEYAINGTIGKLDFSSNFKEEVSIYDPVNMQTYHSPAKFIYTAEVGGIIKIYEIPSMRVVKTFDFKGKKVRREDVKTDRQDVLFGAISSKRTRSNAKKLDIGMIQEAARRGVEDQTIEFKNFFAKRGYIVEKKKLGKKSIFKISLGSVDGIKKGDKFDVITKIEETNPLTNKKEITTIKIAEGVISREITPNYCWIKIDGKKSAQKIRLGDTVKMKYRRTFGSKLKKITTSMAEI